MAHNATYSIDFDTEEWNELFSQGQPKHFGAGSFICVQGCVAKEIIFIKQGVIKHSCFLSNGNEKVLAYETAPVLFQGLSVFLRDPTPITTIAVTPLDAIIIPADPVKTVFAKSSTLTEAVIISLARKLSSLSHHAVAIYEPVPKRLAKFIQNTAEYGIMIGDSNVQEPTLRQEDIASLIGTTRPRVSQFLKELEKMGLISIKNGKICVVDKEKMQCYIDA